MTRAHLARRFRSILLALMLPMPPLAAAADFAAAPATIPDGNANGVDLPFNVSGILGSVDDVRVSITLTHTFVGDLRATLISPAGSARLILFARVGGKRSSALAMQSNLAGTYVFDDDATQDFWAGASAASDATPILAGSYRTSSAGNPTKSNHGGCGTSLRLAFRGLSGAQVNGTWTLNIADVSTTQVGAVSAATLSIDATQEVFASGFEDGVASAAPAVIGNCRRAQFDYTGTGLTSFALLRNPSGLSNGPLTWEVRSNLGGSAGPAETFVHGNAGDFYIDGDFDGDAIADAVVWNQGAGEFRIRRSSRPTLPAQVIRFGQAGDDPGHVGDYDGDRIADATVYRAGAASGQASSTLILLSSTGSVRTLTTGENGSFAGGGLDFSGDGRADIAIQSNAGGGVARFRVFEGTTGALSGDFTFGAPTDVFVMGSHTGSPHADITTVRAASGQINWTTRDSETDVGQPTVALGASASDFPLAGDFDGDGLDDYAVWRPNNAETPFHFIVRRSTLPDAAPLLIPAGQAADYPIANSRAH